MIHSLIMMMLLLRPPMILIQTYIPISDELGTRFSQNEAEKWGKNPFCSNLFNWSGWIWVLKNLHLRVPDPALNTK